MSYIDDFINMVNDIECQKAVEHFNANQLIEKGWITTEDGKHLFIGADGALHGGKSAYEAHQNESGSSSSGKDSGKDNSEAPKTTEMYTGPAKAFGTEKGAKEYFGDAWDKSLTDDETDAVKYYTGTGYLDINPKLRGGDNIDPHSALGNMLQDLDSAIAKSELKEAITVYRYSDPTLFGLPFNASVTGADLEHLIGATVTDNGFMSTSVLDSATDDFGRIGFTITVPPGKGKGAYIANISKYKGEQEFLLARSSNLKITEVSDYGTGTIFIHATVVD